MLIAKLQKFWLFLTKTNIVDQEDDGGGSQLIDDDEENGDEDEGTDEEGLWLFDRPFHLWCIN